MSVVDGIADLLRNDPAIAAIVADRVFTRDVRRDRTPDAFTDPYGYVRPTLCVLRGPWGRPMFTLSQARQDVIHLLMLGPDTDEGSSGINKLADRAYVLLHRWRDPETRFAVMFQSAIGDQATVLADGVMQRLTFTASGVPKGVRD